MVRSDKFIGCGSCSVIDECFDDSEILELLADSNITRKNQILPFLYRYHNDWISSLNYGDFTNGTISEPLI